MEGRQDAAAALRAGIERWNEGALESAPTIWHEDIIWEEAPGFPDSGVHHGRDAVVARMGERLSLLGDVKIEVLGVQMRGRYALVEVRIVGRGVTSGAPAPARSYWAYRFTNDGRMIHWREFLDRSTAEAAFRDATGR